MNWSLIFLMWGLICYFIGITCGYIYANQKRDRLEKAKIKEEVA